tara:strand:- start:708 stop:1352 length:645 start_codon:yes stop_codon:yes gene_type:complete
MFGHNNLDLHQTFNASVINSTLVDNYDPANYKLFIGYHGDGVDNRDDGTVQHDYDKGFKIIVHDDATMPQEIVLTSLAYPQDKTASFTVNPGETLRRDGRVTQAVHVTSDGVETKTELPWIRSASYTIGINTTPDASGAILTPAEVEELIEDEEVVVPLQEEEEEEEEEEVLVIAPSSTVAQEEPFFDAKKKMAVAVISIIGIGGYLTFGRKRK